MRIVQSRNREYPRIYERNEQRLAKDHHRLRPGGGPPGNRTSGGEDTKREDYQIERLHRIAIDAGLDPEIAEMYREFVVTEAKKRHQRIADAGGDPGVLDVFA